MFHQMEQQAGRLHKVEQGGAGCESVQSAVQ